MPDLAALLEPLGPFERNPAIAVAVSGGSDSLGLGLLLAEWVRVRGGMLHVLTIDHGLRAEAAAECAKVAAIFAAIPGCSAHVLRWEGSKPAHGLQAAARTARYRLLTDWCRAHGVLHLALGHTANDQAETVAMREAHGSDAAGLAGMAAVRPLDGVRLVRPLLTVGREAIRDWLRARGQTWIEDPSNELDTFERVRIRRRLDAAATVRALELGERRGVERAATERAAARLLNEAGRVHDAGYLSVDLATLSQVGAAVRETALRQMVLAVGGGDYPVSADRLMAAVDGLAGDAAASIGGCLLHVLRGRLHVFRETAKTSTTCVGPGWSGLWDNRFAIVVSDLPEGGGWRIGPLGENGQRQAVERFGVRLKRHPVPLLARLALPALWRQAPQGEHLVAQPHLKLGQGLAARLAPRHTVTTCGFTVAARSPHTIYSSTCASLESLQNRK